MRQEPGCGDERSRLQRQFLAHRGQERDELRHDVDHQKEQHGGHNDGDDDRIKQEFLGVGRLLVLPFQIFYQAREYAIELTALFAGADQADEDRGKYGWKIGHGQGQVLAAFDRLDHRRGNLPQVLVIDAVAQIRKTFQDWHTGAHQLLEVKAERDELDALDAASSNVLVALEFAKIDQVEAHAAQAHLEIRRVDRIDAPLQYPALGVDRLVTKGLHQCTRAVRSITRVTSSRDVMPAMTIFTATSASIWKPLRPATSLSSFSVAPRAIRSSRSRSKRSTSISAVRPS